MRIKAVEFDDESEPSAFTVVLTTDEMAFLYAIVGNTAPRTIADLTGDQRWALVLDAIADAVGAQGNTYWENGWGDVIPFNIGIRSAG